MQLAIGFLLLLSVLLPAAARLLGLSGNNPGAIYEIKHEKSHFLKLLRVTKFYNNLWLKCDLWLIFAKTVWLHCDLWPVFAPGLWLVWLEKIKKRVREWQQTCYFLFTWFGMKINFVKSAFSFKKAISRTFCCSIFIRRWCTAAPTTENTLSHDTWQGWNDNTTRATLLSNGNFYFIEEIKKTPFLVLHFLYTNWCLRHAVKTSSSTPSSLSTRVNSDINHNESIKKKPKLQQKNIMY